jgi:hypothetical protein
MHLVDFVALGALAIIGAIVALVIWQIAYRSMDDPA